MSALRINLLPAYIAETKKTRNSIIGFSALFVAAVAGSLAYYGVRQGQTTELESQADAKEQEATAATGVVNAIKAESAKLREQIAPIGQRVKFVQDVRFYNAWVQKIYRRAARYTDSRVEYSSMAVNAGSLAMTGYVTGGTGPGQSSAVDNLARYLITFYGNPDVTAVSVTGPPGWQRPSQASVNPLDQPSANTASANGFSFSVNATLLRPLQRPALPETLATPPAVTEPLPTGGPPVAGAGAAAPGTTPGAGISTGIAPPPGVAGPEGPSEEDR
ncbi:MAG: hypothetical protein H7145_07200 [Akkermansiaceae bacterium]|nr:hypothetical protein [Armatimonadota bacterium]